MSRCHHRRNPSQKAELDKRFTYIMPLEPRIMFDAAAVATVDAAVNNDTAGTADTAAESSSGHEAAFVDASLKDSAALMQGFDRNIKVIALHEGTDHLARISQYLAENSNVTALHLFGHGIPGALRLGDAVLSSDTLADHASQLESWKQSLTADADILLYGCDVAAGSGGELLLTELAHLTGADVAASSDATGGVAAGGNWVLERSTGPIEAAALTAAGYDGLLAATAVNDANSATPRATAEDTPLAVTGISITDADSPANMTVRVQTTGGSSSVTLSGAIVSAGTNGSADFTISGSLAQINATLASLTFTNELNKNSSTSGYSAKIDLTATDVTNGGTGTLSISNISVTAVNDAPDLSTRTNLILNEGGSTAFSLQQLATDANALDVDIQTGQQVLVQQMVQIKSLPSDGTLTYKGGPVVVDTVVPVSELGSLVFTHTGGDLAAPKTVSFTVAVSDGGGAITNGTLNIVINPVNKAPTISGSPSLYEGQSKAVAPTINLGDTADTLENSTITISDVVTGGQGSFFIDANNNGVMDGGETAFAGGALTATQLGQLRFFQNGYEPNTPGAVSPSYKIFVQDYGGRSDGTGTKLTTTETITLTVLPNNDQPVVQNYLHHDAASALEVNERSTTTITTAMLQVTDPDLNPADPSQTWPAANIVYTVVTPPEHGQLQLEVSAGVWKSLDVGGRFTQADIDSGRVRYYQSAELTGEDLIPEKFTFTVRDSAYGYELPTPDTLGNIVPGAVREGNVATGAIKTLEFAFMLKPVDGTDGGTAPTYDSMTYDFSKIGTNFNGQTSGWKEGNVGSDGVITTAMLEYKITRTIGSTPVVLPPAETVYTLTAPPTNGVIQRDTGSGNWQTLDINATFTQADINGGKIRFVHDGNEDFINSFGFTVSDGTEAGSLDRTFTIHVAPVNDLPTGSGGSVNVLEGNNNSVRLGSGVLGMTDVDGTTDTEPNATNTTGNVLWNSEGLADSLWFKILTGPTTNSGSGDVQGKLQYWNGSAWTDITPGAELWLHSSLLTTTADGATSGLRYVHNGTEPLAYTGGPKLTFTYQVRDDLAAPGNAFDTNTSAPDATDAGTDQAHVSTTVSATIGIIPVNNCPQIADKPGDADPDITAIGTITGGGATVGKNEILHNVPEGGTATITSVHLTAVDSDNTTVQRQYRITSAPTLGVLQLSGKTLGVGSTFTQDDIDNNRLTYKHNGDEVGALIDGFGAQYHDKFHFVVNDGVLEDAGADADRNVFLVTLKPMNDKPTVATPASLDVLAADTNTVAVPGVSVDDPDLAAIIAGSEENFIRVEVQVLTSGGAAVGDAMLNYTGSDPSTGGRAYNSGKNTNTLVIQGTKAEVNAALATLTVAFDNDEDVSSHKIRVTVDDRLYTDGGVLASGANGGIAATNNSDGSDIDAANNRVSKEITLTASNQNDVPTISNSSSYTVNEDGNVTLNGFSLSDADSFNRNVTVKVELFSDSDRSTPANATTEGKLTYSGLSNVTASGNNSNTVTLTGTMANVQAALNQIKFQGAADYNGAGSGDGTLYLKTTFTDFGHADVPGGNSVTVNNDITIKPVNDAPVLTVPSNKTMAEGAYIDITTGFTVQDTKDISQGATDYIEVTLNAKADGSDYGTLTIQTLGSATVESNGTSTIVVKGTNTQVKGALNSLRYTPDAANVDKVVTITATADDRSGGVGNGKEGTGVDGSNTAVKTFTVTISGTNDAPVVTAPAGPVTVAEDNGGTTISGISYTDADDFGGVQRITVSVTHGTLDFGTKTGLALVEGTTYNSATVIVEGTKANLNAALATLKYKPTADYHGSDTLTVTADDKGLIGTGGAKTDTETVAITVTPVNDRPVATTDVTLAAIDEDGGASPSVAFSGLTFGYSDAVDNQTGNSGNDTSTAFSYIAIIDNAATAAQGVWQVSDGSGGWITIPTSGLGITSALVFEASREVRFLPAADFNGTPGKLTVRLADNSHALTGSTNAGDKKNLNDTANGDADLATGAWNDTNRTIGISVTAVNDAPTATGVAPTVTVGEDAANPAGQTVSALFGGNFSDAKDTVADGSSANGFAGVAIVGATSDKGVWEYNSGSGWAAVPTDVAADKAFILAATDQLRFRPTTADYNGTPGDSLTVRLIDNSAGAATSGARPDLSGAGSGGSTQYSDLANAVVLGALLTPVNDAPTLTANGKTSGIAVTVTETDAVTGSGNAFETALLTSVAVGDIDLSTTTGLVAGTFGSGTITVTLTDKISGDILTVNDGLSGIDGVTAYNAGTGQLVVTLAQGATTAQVQAILEAVKYAHQSDDPTDKLSGTEKSTRAFTVVLSDGNNLQASGNAGGPAPLSATVSGTITITPLNDPPVANNDTTSVTENTDSPTSGNVITGKDRNNSVQPGQNDTDPDTPVADLRVTNIVPPPGGSGGGTITTNPVTVSGKYGELTIHPDGSYTYTLDETNPTVNALNNGGTLTDEVFTYTLSDGDKTDTATLTITINGKTDGPPSITPVDGNGGGVTGHATVNESGLVVDGDGSETTTGTITVQADAGIKTVTIGGTEITLATLKNLPPDGIAINTPDGRITVSGFTPTSSFGSEVYNGTIAYTYTLAQAQTTPGATEGTEAVSLVVTDKTEVATPGTLTIQVIDHTPAAAADTAQMSKSVGTVTGNVYTNDAIGADGPAIGGPVTAGTTVGSYGTLTLNADGSYSYDIDPANAAVQALTAGSTLTETIAYTITDRDGDTSTAVLTITIIGNSPPVAQNDVRTTPEDTLVSGNVIKDGGDGDVADTDPENDTLTLTKVTIGGVDTLVPGDGSKATVTITGKGTLEIDKTGAYSFTPVADWNGTVPDITYTVTDGHNVRTAELKITVTPVVDIADDSTSTPVNTPKTISVLSTDSFENSDAKVTAVTNGSHGTVSIDPDTKRVIYTPDSGFTGRDTFTYTVTSGGVTEIATVTIDMYVPNAVPTARPDTYSTTSTTPVSGNLGTDDFMGDGSAAQHTWSKASDPSHGTVTLNPDGSFTYTPNAGFGGTDAFTYTLTDANGDASTATVTIIVTAAPPVEPPPVEPPPVEPPPVEPPPVEPPPVEPPPVEPPPVEPPPVKPPPVEPPPLISNPPVAVEPPTPVIEAPVVVSQTPVTVVVETPSITGAVQPPQIGAQPGTSSNWAATPLQDLVEQGRTEPSYNSMPVFTIAGVVVQGGENTIGQEGLYLVKTPSSQIIIVDQTSGFNLPTGTFRHSKSDARVGLEATQADGQPLPGWLSFDPDSGRFTGRPPLGTGGVMDIKVMARDNQGNVAFTQFLLRIAEQDSQEAKTLTGDKDAVRDADAANGDSGQNRQPAAPGQDALPQRPEGSSDGGEQAEASDVQNPDVTSDANKPLQQKRGAEVSGGRPSFAEQLRQQRPRSHQAQLLASLQHAVAGKK